MNLLAHVIVIVLFVAVAALNGYGVARLRRGDNVLSHREYQAYQAGLALSALLLLVAAIWIAA